MKSMANLIFITRHNPTSEQLLIARKLGYDNIEMITHTFSKNPVEELQDIGITLQKHPLIAIVAPAHIHVQLWQAGFQTLEFRNIPNARAEGKFSCDGAYKMGLDSQGKFKME
jgi:hypothetical protein